jgi:aryl-alcohol dehydrogenase-like predicted oxidoreductase
VGATKWCVFRPVDPTRAVVEAAVAERMKRMQTNRVDLLQVRDLSLAFRILLLKLKL